MTLKCSKILLVVLLAGCFAAPACGVEAVKTDKTAVARQKSVRDGVMFLRKMQNEDGSFSPELGPGITSLVATALLRNGIPEQDPLVAKSLRYVEQFVQDNGGIYNPESQFNLNNYETSLAMMCFTEVKEARFAKHLERAKAYIKSIQWDGELSDSAYGGAGYGKHKRPDLSNTTFFIEALKSSGVDADDPDMQEALVFVSRCQNLESEHNTFPFSNKVGDGGFYYTIAAGGSSQAGETDNNGLRSYGSMTYAGLKSMIYAGVDKQDPRVKAAVKWISRNYDLSQNPGMKLDGLYYYYHTFAKSLDALGESALTDAAGKTHDWRAELVEELAKKQQKDGSWVNESDRWFEGDTSLVTAYALLSLSYCDAEAAK